MKKLHNLFLNWQDRSTFIGIGKIIEKIDNNPVVVIDDNYYLPKRCLVEIVDSKFYKKGFKKHFIIPFQITYYEANKINKKQDKKELISYPIFDEIKSRNNPIVDTYLDLELIEFVMPILREFQYKNKSIPEDLMKEIISKKKEADDYREIRR